MRQRLQIDRNRLTVLVNDVEEVDSIELTDATKELEKATVAVEDAETSFTVHFTSYLARTLA